MPCLGYQPHQRRSKYHCSAGSKGSKDMGCNSTDAFEGRVNGEVQVGRSFVVNPFKDDHTIHYIIGDDDLVKMANNSDIVKPIEDIGRQLMRFELDGIKQQQ